MSELASLLARIRSCQLCAASLPNKPNPVLRAHEDARLLIVGQAPGIRVHNTGIPWNDASGERLRAWLSIDRTTFYDEKKIAIIPIAYCYPGTGSTGDLPPSKICSEHWLASLLKKLPNIQLTLLVGQYAHAYYLKSNRQATLTKTVQHFENYLPQYLPLPHPSPRNNRWFKKNPWFQQKIVPIARQYCQSLLS